MRKVVFCIDYLNFGESHYFFNTSLLKNLYQNQDVDVHFVTFEKNVSYNNFCTIHPVFKSHGIGSIFQNILNAIRAYLFVVRLRKSSSDLKIIFLSIEYLLMPFLLYFFSLKKVNIFVHQNRIDEYRGMKLFLWKIYLNSKKFNFIFLSSFQILKLNRSRITVRNALTIIHPI